MKLKAGLLLHLFVLLTGICLCQNPVADSLKLVITSLSEDTTKVDVLLELSNNVFRTDPDSAIVYANKAKELAGRLNYQKGLGYALKNIGLAYYVKSDFVEVLNYWRQSLDIFQSIDDKLGISNLNNNIGAVYFNYGGDPKALEYYLESLQAAEQLGDKLRIATALSNIGAVYAKKASTYDKAMDNYLRAMAISEEVGDLAAIGTAAVNLGEIYLKKEDYKSALSNFEKALDAMQKSGGNASFVLSNIGKTYALQGKLNLGIQFHQKAVQNARDKNSKLQINQSLNALAELYQLKGDLRLALDKYLESESIAREIGSNGELQDAYHGLAKVYSKLSDYESAYKYQRLFNNIQNTIYNIESDQKMANLEFQFDLQKKEVEIELLKKDNDLNEATIQRAEIFRNFLFAAGGFLLIIIAGIYYQFRFAKKSNKVIQIKNEQLEETLDNLKTTQEQLIMQEKMASLGQMTAGIAHEIKNPLNFVNNYAEGSVELSNELKEELEGYQKSHDPDAYQLILELLDDIQQNAVFIHDNGQRANNIVSSMMDHANENRGERVSTDLNTLVEEYTNLAYHGYKAKKMNFEVDFQKQLDTNLPPIFTIPQDIGRVLINLINNAIYAVDQKSQLKKQGYKPSLLVSTRKVNKYAEIRIRDNGPGIPATIKDNIFNPFFTTKPTGEGNTGLGLSISYEIVTRGHQGKMDVESEEGKFTEFIILLPVSSVRPNV